MLSKEKIKLGIAPIAWTNDDLPELGKENTFEQCISEMALAGYEGSEVGNKYPKDVKILKEKLDLRGLTICNAWFSTFFALGKEEETVEQFLKHRDFLYELGAKVIGCSEQSYSIQGKEVPIFEEKPVFTKEEWNRIYKGYDRLAQLAKEKGMKVCLHHHMGTGIQTPEEVKLFMDGTNDNVYLLFDSGHIFYSEGSQMATEQLLKDYIDRIVHIHLKDVRSQVVEDIRNKRGSFLQGVKKGTFTVPGDGDIDFEPLFKIIEEAGYHGFMVVEAEQDPAIANPFAYALKARRFIREKAGL